MLASCRVCLWLLPVTPWLAVSSGQEEVSRFQPDSAKTPVSITSRTCSFGAENKAEGIGRHTKAHHDSIANRWGGVLQLRVRLAELSTARGFATAIAPASERAGALCAKLARSPSHPKKARIRSGLEGGLGECVRPCQTLRL